ncbi:hypothetical protein D3C79_161610 [compost metagenome]
MSSRLKVTSKPPYAEAAERLSQDMGKRLQVSAGLSLQTKLASGEVKIVNGRYVMSDGMKITRPFGFRRKTHSS